MSEEALGAWVGSFGDEYTERNKPTSAMVRARTLAMARMLAPIATRPPRTILEVGCNAGANLRALAAITDAELWAVEPNALARREAVLTGAIGQGRVLDGTVTGLPLKGESMDLVFTSGVLIHVPPEDLDWAMKEIARVSGRYILTCEYFAPSVEPEPVTYRGAHGLLWRCDYGSRILNLFPNLRLLGHGFHWKPATGIDNATWWLFEKGV